MPSLFVLPKQVPLTSAASLMAGAKLLFSATGSSTPQNTYSDILLTTPNANPVIADANGVFAPIYLDPSLPNYRVILKTSADVVIYTVDDVPSNQNTAQTFRLKAASPSLTFEETDASANNKIWRLKVNGEQFILSILNDAEAVETTVFTFDRTGTTVDSLNFAGDYLQVQGQTVATGSTGTMLVTLTGMTTVVTGTITWRRTGHVTTLSTTAAITGISNTTAMKMTGLTIVPLGTSKLLPTIVTDNGANTLAHGLLTGGQELIFGVGLTGGNFTAAGTKGIPAGWEFHY